MRRARELAESSFNLRSASDIVVTRLLGLPENKDQLNAEFSADGWRELVEVHARVMTSLSLSLDLLLSGDVDCARQLMKEKRSLSTAERKSRRRHLKRLQEGTEVNFESSDIHLETLGAFRDLNSRISAVAYSVLDRNGMLLGTRLIEKMEDGQPA